MNRRIIATLAALLLLGAAFAPAALADEQADTDISRSIRSAIHRDVDEPMLSTNVDVFTEGGTVYLRGSVP